MAIANTVLVHSITMYRVKQNKCAPLAISGFLGRQDRAVVVRFFLVTQYVIHHYSFVCKTECVFATSTGGRKKRAEKLHLV